jgi:outer membrane lipoprotein SlyB
LHWFFLESFVMNTAIENTQPGQQAPSNPKPLWAAVGILGVAVLGMGGTMIYQGRSATTAAQVVAVAPTPSVVASEVVKPAGAASAARTSAGGANAADDMIEKPSVQPAKPAPLPTKKVVKPVPQPMPSPAPSSAGDAPAPAPTPAPVAVVAAPICGNCGSIESVTPVERTTKADGPGVGAVAGGVAGAVLGNQVGSGNGRTVATILGAIGGGLAGNAIERNIRKETVYQVGLRMDDGSRRTVELSQAPPVGSKVTVEGTGIRSSEGAVYRAPATVAARVNQSAPTYQTP